MAFFAYCSSRCNSQLKSRKLDLLLFFGVKLSPPFFFQVPMVSVRKLAKHDGWYLAIVNYSNDKLENDLILHVDRPLIGAFPMVHPTLMTSATYCSRATNHKEAMKSPPKAGSYAYPCIKGCMSWVHESNWVRELFRGRPHGGLILDLLENSHKLPTFGSGSSAS